jgi:hypothetical protein
MKEGESVLINNFLKLTPTIAGRYETPDEDVDPANYNIKASISSSFEEDVRSQITFSRTPYTIKTPNPVFVNEAEARTNFFGELLTIRGSNLNFDFEDSQQGVFANNTYTPTSFSRVQPYAYVTDTRVVVLNQVIPTETSDYKNEYQLRVRVRYTTSGSLREGVYQTPLRTKIVLTDTAGVLTNNSIFNSHLEV